MSSINVNAISNEAGTGAPNFPNGLSVNSNPLPTAGSLSNRNKIINGDMVIDQRNAGAAVTVNSSGNFYVVDRFFATGQSTDGVFTAQQSSVAPAGFNKSLLATVTTADASIGAAQQYLVGQAIEGLNVAELGWGSSDAQTVTLSFWVRSSLTGTFGGSLMNSAFDRSYPFSYAISSADTWEYKTVTVVGDTSGTWLTTNGVGIRLYFSLGAGSTYVGTAGSWNGSFLVGVTGQTNLIATNGATFYLTGVQLEVGDTATPFEHRSYGQELTLCQRYFQKVGSTFFGATEGTDTFNLQVPFWVPMRASATVTGVSGGIFNCRYAGDTNITNPTLANIQTNTENVWLQVVSSGLSSGVPIYGRSQNFPTSNFLNASAEL
jgi:hypothetical protein